MTDKGKTWATGDSKSLQYLILLLSRSMWLIAQYFVSPTRYTEGRLLTSFNRFLIIAHSVREMIIRKDYFEEDIDKFFYFSNVCN